MSHHSQADRSTFTHMHTHTCTERERKTDMKKMSKTYSEENIKNKSQTQKYSPEQGTSRVSSTIESNLKIHLMQIKMSRRQNMPPVTQEHRGRQRGAHGVCSRHLQQVMPAIIPSAIIYNYNITSGSPSLTNLSKSISCLSVQCL